jgi:hypothetical protein
MSVGDLVRHGQAEVLKGVRVRPEDCQSSGVPVLRTRDIRDGGDPEEPCFVDPEALRSRPKLTVAGDIVVSPASGRLKASVDEEGGHILASPVQGVRLVGDQIDPHGAAAFLESPRNRRFVTGTAYARVNVRDLELPVLQPEELERLRSTLDALQMYERLAEEAQQAARALREALLELPSLPIAEGRNDA